MPVQVQMRPAQLTLIVLLWFNGWTSHQITTFDRFNLSGMVHSDPLPIRLSTRSGSMWSIIHKIPMFISFFRVKNSLGQTCPALARQALIYTCSFYLPRVIDWRPANAQPFLDGFLRRTGDPFLSLSLSLCVYIYIYMGVVPHARLLVSEWHLQIWMCVFCCSGERPRKRGVKFAKGLNTTICKYISYSML